MGISELLGAAACLENECLSACCFKRLLENEGCHSNTEKKFKQLILHAWLNRVGWAAESSSLAQVGSFETHLLDVFSCHPGRCAEARRAEQCGRSFGAGAGTLKCSDDSWAPQHKMTQTLVKDQVWQSGNCQVLLCPFERDKDLDFDSPFYSQTPLWTVYCRRLKIKSFEECTHYMILIFWFFFPWFILYQSSATVNKTEYFQKI